MMKQFCAALILLGVIGVPVEGFAANRTYSAGLFYGVGVESVRDVYRVKQRQCINGEQNCYGKNTRDAAGQYTRQAQSTYSQPAPTNRAPTTANQTQRSAQAGTREALRERNREIQRSLNYFEYPVGTVDGALGRKSKTAIENFERDMGFPVNGQLSDNERNFLIGSYQRSQGSLYGREQEIYASKGPSGLLRVFRNQRLGIQTPASPTAKANVRAPNNTLAGGLVPFVRRSTNKLSMNAHCQTTNTLTLSNGYAQDAANITNANLAISEQFCEARQFSMFDGQNKATSIQNTAEQISQICDQILAVLSPAVDAISVRDMGSVLAITEQLVFDQDVSARSLVTTSQVCLNVGFENDDPRLTAASALLLIVGDKAPYAEIIGHQLHRGFGFEANTSLAKDWYVKAINAPDPIIYPSEAQSRYAVIRKAIGLNEKLANLSPEPGDDYVTRASLRHPLADN